MRKGFAAILVLGLVVSIFVLGATFYFFKQNQKPPQNTVNQITTPNTNRTPTLITPTPKAMPSSDKTANWKIYTNEKYGFSIRYPNKWIACDQIVKLGVSTSKLLYILYLDSQTQCQAYKGQAGLIAVSIFIYDKSVDYAKPYLNPSSNLQALNIPFAGVEAYQSQNGQKIELLRGNYFYSIDATRDDNPNPENVETIDTILTTFKFLN